MKVLIGRCLMLCQHQRLDKIKRDLCKLYSTEVELHYERKKMTVAMVHLNLDQ